MWSSYYKKDIDILEKVQRRATKIIYGFSRLSYEERLRRLDLFPLHQRRIRGDLIETYKIITGKEKIQSDKFFSKAETSYLRGNSHKLYKKQFRTDIRKHFFSMRVVDAWNKLPEKVVMSETTDQFKRGLDKWLLGCRQ